MIGSALCTLHVVAFSYAYDMVTAVMARAFGGTAGALLLVNEILNGYVGSSCTYTGPRLGGCLCGCLAEFEQVGESDSTCEFGYGSREQEEGDSKSKRRG